MHFLALLLGVTVAATPAPSPAPLTPLKVIGSVRSTPFCTALRETIAPAIAAVLSNDDLIASSKPAFATLYHDDVLSRSEARAHLDLNRLESLITPIVANVKRADGLLANKPSDRKLQAMRDKLQAVLAQQKESLNVISGFVATEQLGEIQTAGAPENWASALSANPQAPTQHRAAQAPPPAAKSLFSAGVHNANPGPRDPRYDAATVGPTYDPFASLVSQIQAQQIAGQSAESAAAQLVTEALTLCAP
ncbi:MAG TPA: hypothetical protein VFW34_10380 [Candidatus Rubrimentiphilum sp.]|nr:hypothetical protein [Candidatus Rubrimentiphilum sp.]